MKELSRYLNGWVAHFWLCTEEATKALRAVDAHIRRRLRAIIIRQRKRPRFLFRHLRSRGERPCNQVTQQAPEAATRRPGLTN